MDYSNFYSVKDPRKRLKKQNNNHTHTHTHTEKATTGLICPHTTYRTGDQCAECMENLDSTAKTKLSNQKVGKGHEARTSEGPQGGQETCEKTSSIMPLSLCGAWHMNKTAESQML